MFHLYERNQYDARNVFFKGIDPRFKFVAEIKICESIRISPVLDCSVMNNSEPKNVARSVHYYSGEGIFPDTQEWNKVSYKELTDGKVHTLPECYCRNHVVMFNSIDELDRIWADCVKEYAKMHNGKEPVCVFERTTPKGFSCEDAWTLKCYDVPYTGMVRSEWEEGFSKYQLTRDATDEKNFYRTIREVIAHYKKIFTPKNLDEIVSLFKKTYNKAEQERRDGINGRMNKLLELQKGDKPLPPPPTTNEWWQGLTEEEKESIRTKATKGAKKSAKGVKKPAKK